MHFNSFMYGSLSGPVASLNYTASKGTTCSEKWIEKRQSRRIAVLTGRTEESHDNLVTKSHLRIRTSYLLNMKQ